MNSEFFEEDDFGFNLDEEESLDFNLLHRIREDIEDEKQNKHPDEKLRQKLLCFMQFMIRKKTKNELKHSLAKLMQLSDKNELFIKLFSRSQKVETMRANFIELFDRLLFGHMSE